MFNLLRQEGNNYYITKKKEFMPINFISKEIIEKTFNFAYRMTFAQEGEHRTYRSGGSYPRKKGEIFANTFQGKIAEYVLFLTLIKEEIPVSEPDLSVFRLGQWDSVDLTIADKSISIKSTKSFGNLLLLEQKDWDNTATYIPNKKGYDFTFFIRINPFCEEIMKRQKLLYSNTANKEKLFDLISSNDWKFDIPGFVTREDLMYIIQKNHVIPKGAKLNGKMPMDASNYYIQASDMRPIEDFIAIFK